ncbi:MAG: hypothetical protein ACJ748_01645 [Flavisolibacter sp.]
MYENIYLPVQHLRKPPVINPGGLCSVLLAKWGDVLLWPEINPQTGTITSDLQLKPGGTFYIAESSPKDRAFTQQGKADKPGNYMDIVVTLMLPGNTTNNTLSLQAMQFHDWVLIIQDKDGNKRLIGNEDSGATLLYQYTTEDHNGTRKRTLTFAWQHPIEVPIYEGAAFTLDTTVVVPAAGSSFTLITRFQVGAAGSPMTDVDTAYANNALTQKRVLVFASGMALPCDDGSADIDWAASNIRHIQKDVASNTINYIGGVVNQEIHEIYAFS